MVMPGDNTRLEIQLITPIAVEKGLRFAIREAAERWEQARSPISWNRLKVES